MPPARGILRFGSRRFAGHASIGDRLLPGAVLALGALVLLVACPAPGPPPSPPAQGPFVRPYIQGFLVATGISGAPTGVVDPGAAAVSRTPVEFFAPGITVELRDSASQAVKASVRTDLSGRFLFSPVSPGTYLVCWHANGYAAGCHKTVVVIRDLPFLLGWLPITVAQQAGVTTLFGKVRLRSGGSLRTLEPMANVNSFAIVRLLDLQGTVLDSAYVNTFGEYLLPAVRVSDHVQVVAQLEAVTETRTVVKELLALAAAHRVDLTLDNWAPTRVELLTLVGGKHIRTASPGGTVDLRASAVDADGDPLRFRWILPAGSGTLNQTTGSAVIWKLPPTPGNYMVYVVAYDGKGGYAQTRAWVSTTGQGIEFSGKVNATDAPAVDSAEIDVNGRKARTNADGYFVLYVPETDRYVLNIRKPEYNLISQIHTHGVAAGRWTLTRATVRTVNPTQPIDIVDAREFQRCEGAFTSRVNWQEFVEQSKPRYQDGKGNVVRVGRPGSAPLVQSPKERCGPGIRIQIPPNALVDSAGNPPPGNVQVALYTVDLLAPFDMPGDFGAEDTAGNTIVMESYGAGMVDVFSGNTRYNLRAGSTATVTLPIDATQLQYPAPEPATMPLLFYDERRGVWVQDRMMFQRQGNAYVAQVTHFSYVNADVDFVSPACVQIFSGPPGNGFAQIQGDYTLEVTVPLTAGAAPKVITKPVTNTSPYYHIVYYLPANTNIVLVPHKNNKPYGTFIVNSGGAVTPHPPAPDFQACQGKLTLYDVAEPAPGPNSFLSGLFSFQATNLNELQNQGPAGQQLKTQLEQAARNYYAQVDPRRLRTNLTAFKQQNGLSTTPGTLAAGEVLAVYANSADLGFGREMHCKKTVVSGLSGFDVACYVTNYGLADGKTDNDESEFQQAITGAGTGTGGFATVAMEYSRIEDPGQPGDPIVFSDPDRVTKFYVYNAAGDTVPSADLDGWGQRPIPQLCLVCHGGALPTTGVPTFASRADVKLGAVFIPFDLSGLTIADGLAPAGLKEADQQDDFKQLNDIVRASNAGVVYTEIIDSMYQQGGVLGALADQREDFKVAGWRVNAAQQDMYINVLRPACRMCHGSRPLTNPAGDDLRFHTANAFNPLGEKPPFRACKDPRIMPHAQATYDRFWQSVNPHQPAQFIAYGVAEVPGAVVGSPPQNAYVFYCTPPPVTPPVPPGTISFGNDVVPIFNASCAFSGCHGGASPQAGMNLQTNPYGNIVNVNSTQLPSMKRVTPGNPSQSYLQHKIDNTQLSVGGSGGCMPFGSCPPLMSQTERDKIRNWILQGALSN